LEDYVWPSNRSVLGRGPQDASEVPCFEAYGLVVRVELPDFTAEFWGEGLRISVAFETNVAGEQRAQEMGPVVDPGSTRRMCVEPHGDPGRGRRRRISASGRSAPKVHAKLALGICAKYWSPFRAYGDRFYRTAVKHRGLEFLLKGCLKRIGGGGERRPIRGRRNF
jgi:hypothetical protein